MIRYTVEVRKAKADEPILDVDDECGAERCVAHNNHSFYSAVIVPNAISLVDMAIEQDEAGAPFVVLDCSALAADRPNAPTVWEIFPHEGEWCHGPSGSSGPLAQVIAGILDCYVP